MVQANRRVSRLFKAVALGFLSVSVLWAIAKQPAQAAGSFKNGNQLLQDCLSQASFDRGQCVGYVISVSDMFGGGATVLGLRVCIPDGVVAGQLKDLVVRYLQNRPEMRHYAASDLVSTILAGGFPCKK